MNVELLKRMIEEMRFRLIKVTLEKGNFIDAEVIELSQQLDELILQYQKMNALDISISMNNECIA